MKTRTFLITLSVLVFIIFTAEIASDNGRAVSVGSPGEVTCNTTNCHNSFTINTGGGIIELNSNMTN